MSWKMSLKMGERVWGGVSNKEERGKAERPERPRNQGLEEMQERTLSAFEANTFSFLISHFGPNVSFSSLISNNHQSFSGIALRFQTVQTLEKQEKPSYSYS